jgi:hypothetical protein
MPVHPGKLLTVLIFPAFSAPEMIGRCNGPSLSMRSRLRHCRTLKLAGVLGTPPSDETLLILLKIEPQRGKRLGSQRRPAQDETERLAQGHRRDDPMQKPILALLAMLLAGLASAHGAEVQVGRYQMIAVPASQSQTFPETLLMDTATGQTWILYHETGQSIEWLPLRFSAGKDRPATPLPPSPDAVGVSR